MRAATCTPPVTAAIDTATLTAARERSGLGPDASSSAVIRYAVALLAGRDPQQVEAAIRRGRPKGGRNRPKTQTAAPAAA